MSATKLFGERATKSYGDNARQRVVSYRVNDPDPDDAMEDAGLPQPGDLLKAGSLYKVTDYEAEQERGRGKGYCIVDVVYSITDAQPTPTDESPQVEWDTVTVMVPVRTGFLYGGTEVVTEDSETSTIVNSAGDIPDPLPEEELKILQVTVVRTEATWDPLQAYRYRNAINDFTTTVAGLTVGKHCAKLTIYRAEKFTQAGTIYWRVTYQVQFAPPDLDDTGAFGTWHQRFADEGYYWVDTELGKVGFVDDQGQEVKRPGRLDGSAGMLGETADTVYREYRTLEEVDFSTLALATVHTD